MPKNWFKEAKKKIYQREFIDVNNINSVSIELDDEGDLKLTLYECEQAGMFGSKKVLSEISSTMTESGAASLVKAIMMRMGILTKGDNWDDMMKNFEKERKGNAKSVHFEGLAGIVGVAQTNVETNDEEDDE